MTMHHILSLHYLQCQTITYNQQKKSMQHLWGAHWQLVLRLVVGDVVSRRQTPSILRGSSQMENIWPGWLCFNMSHRGHHPAASAQQLSAAAHFVLPHRPPLLFLLSMGLSLRRLSCIQLGGAQQSLLLSKLSGCLWWAGKMMTPPTAPLWTSCARP